MKYITSSNVGSRNFYLPASGLVLWGEATAPDGWSFETSLDGYFVMGYTSVDLTARGSATHTHTNPSTNSTGSHNNHSVTVSTSDSADGTNTARTDAIYDDTYLASWHTHAVSSTSNESLAGNHSHTIGNTNSASNMPLYRELRWITSASGLEIPIGAIVMHSVSSTALGASWKVCDGSNGTPDMRGYFVYGGSGSGGGASSHSHTNPNTSSNGAHTHTVDVVSADSDIYNAYNVNKYSTGNETAGGHKHTKTGAQSSSGGAHTHTVNNTSSNTVLPPYIQLYFLRRIS